MKIDVDLIEKEIVDRDDYRHVDASVVVVAYNTDATLFTENLSSLFHQSCDSDSYEVIVVDNSDRKDLEPIVSGFPVKYIKLKKNAGLSVGRNVGIGYTRGDIVIFLDDDAIPASDFIQQHINAYKSHDIVGLRGKALPRTGTIYNHLATTYDLGERVFPHYLNLEGNSSLRKDILEQMGGFYTQITGAGGYEGAELSYRIVNHFKDKKKLIYYPGAVIYHDNCGTFFKYFQKRRRHLKYKKRLTEKYPNLFAFLESYELPEEPELLGSKSISQKIRLGTIKILLTILLKLYKKFLRGVQGGSFFKKSPPGRRRQ